MEACAVLQHRWGGGARKTLTRVPHRGWSPAWEAPSTSRPQFPLLSPASLRLFCLDPLRDLGDRRSAGGMACTGRVVEEGYKMTY